MDKEKLINEIFLDFYDYVIDGEVEKAKLLLDNPLSDLDLVEKTDDIFMER